MIRLDDLEYVHQEDLPTFDKVLETVSSGWVKPGTYTVKFTDIRGNLMPSEKQDGTPNDYYPGRYMIWANAQIMGLNVEIEKVRFLPEYTLNEDGSVAKEHKRWAAYVAANGLNPKNIQQVCEHMQEIGAKWDVWLLAKESENSVKLVFKDEEIEQAKQAGYELRNILSSKKGAVKKIAS